MSEFVGRVLVVDDDESLREIIKMFFDFESWEVFEAQNGLAAENIVEKQDLDLIVSDVRMPLVDGLELLDFVKSKKPEIKFILTTGFSEVIETLDAHKRGADNFIAKPFNSKSLADIVRKTINSEAVETQETKEKEEFVDLPIENFYSGSQLLSDIYIKLSETKRLMIARKGDSVPKERMEAYKAKGVQFLSILKQELNTYVSFNIKLAGAVKKVDSVSNRAKRKQLNHAVEMALTESFVGDLDINLYTSSKEMILSLVDNLSRCDDFGCLLEQMSDLSPKLFSHSVGVAVYASLICDKIGWESLRSKSLVAMCGLYHDIGKKEFSEDLIDKPRRKMTREELIIWETHAERGRAILEDIKGIPGEVLQAVSFHHSQQRLNSGNSYSVSGGNFPFAMLIELADHFCNYCLKSGGGEHSVEDSFLKIIDYHLDDIDLKHLLAFMSIFDIEPPPFLLEKTSNLKGL